MFRVALLAGDKTSGPFISTTELLSGTANDFLGLAQRKGLPKPNAENRKIILQLTYAEPRLVSAHFHIYIMFISN